MATFDLSPVSRQCERLFATAHFANALLARLSTRNRSSHWTPFSLMKANFGGTSICRTAARRKSSFTFARHAAQQLGLHLNGGQKSALSPEAAMTTQMQLKSRATSGLSLLRQGWYCQRASSVLSEHERYSMVNLSKLQNTKRQSWRGSSDASCRDSPPNGKRLIDRLAVGDAPAIAYQTSVLGSPTSRSDPSTIRRRGELWPFRRLTAQVW